ncbi:MAG TPA: kelch repeat-containing protein [Kofleriaceae bacterium]|nr:kelch repeat-containing protein [Kofleriaceae bacterium]
MKRSFLVLGLAACAGDGVSITPVIDQPVNDSASAFPLDSVTLSVAHQGAAVDIVSQTLTKGQAIDLGGVPFADDLVLHMTGQLSSSSVAYGRTCPFALDQNATPPAPHLYFAHTVKFGQQKFTPLLRTGGVAVTYHDGSALFLGGSSPGSATTPVTDVERFDPSLGDYRGSLANISARLGPAVALLGLGTETHVAIVGGIDPMTGVGATFVETIEAENPVDRRVERIDDSSMARVGLTATTLVDGDIIVMGGSGDAGSGSASPTDPSTSVDEITLMNGTPTVLPSHEALLHGRWNHTATRLGDDLGAEILVAGGIGAGSGSGAPVGEVAEAELYKPLTGTFSALHPTMVFPRSQHHAIRMPDGSVAIIGGVTTVNAMPQGVKQIEQFTVDGGFADSGASLPDNAGKVDFTATQLPDGRVLITGGRMTPGGPPVATAYILQINTNTGGYDLVATDHLTVPRAGHAATLMCDGTVLITGGTADPQPAERYNPIATSRR